MKIQHIFKGLLTGNLEIIIEDDGTSPTGGYTQAHAEQHGKDYEEGRAAELLGDADVWEWQESKYLPDPEARFEAYRKELTACVQDQVNAAELYLRQMLRIKGFDPGHVAEQHRIVDGFKADLAAVTSGDLSMWGVSLDNFN